MLANIPPGTQEAKVAKVSHSCKQHVQHPYWLLVPVTVWKCRDAHRRSTTRSVRRAADAHLRWHPSWRHRPP